MLSEKDVWDLVSIESHLEYQNPGIWIKEVMKDQKAISIIQQMIKKDISNKIIFTIMDIKDL